MLKSRYVLIGALGAVALSPVSALAKDGVDKTESVEQNTEATVKVDGKLYAKNKMVCKRQAETGTRIKTKTCLTAEQWYQVELDGQAMTDSMQSGINSTRPE